MKAFDLGLKKTPLVKIKDLPKKDVIRLRSSYTCIDNLFGNGWREGSVVLMTGERGCGKTTFWLQLLEDYSKNFEVAYISNEESQDQVREKSVRLNIENVAIASMNSLEDILEIIRTHKIVVVDSFQGIVSEFKDKETISKIINEAKNYNTCVAIILHMTKDKREKGGSEIAHLCDHVIKMVKGVSECFCIESNTIILDSNKNRNGKTGYLVLENGSNGCDFDFPWDEELVESLDKNCFQKGV